MYGSYERTLDDKKRVVIPAKFLVGGRSSFYLSKDLDRSITFRTQSEFEMIKEKFERANQLNPQLRQYMRFFYSQTHEVFPDKSGRILIPRELLEHAAIKREVVFIGLGSRFELLSKENYVAFNETFAAPRALDALVANLSEEGFKL